MAAMRPTTFCATVFPPVLGPVITNVSKSIPSSTVRGTTVPNMSGKHLENSLNLTLFPQNHFTQFVAQMYYRHGFNKQGCPAGRLIVNNSWKSCTIFLLDR